MNRIEALRILGLDEEASAEDIKIAYKETVQILHPDRFASSKKLQERATEQFKNLQEAYDYLTTGKGAAKAQGGTARGAQAGSTPGGYPAAREIEARLAGIAAARTQLVAQRDAILDERRSGLVIGAIGAIALVVLRRVPIALGLGSTAVVWGIVKTVSAISTLNNLDGHIRELTAEKRRLTKRLEDL